MVYLCEKIYRKQSFICLNASKDNINQIEELYLNPLLHITLRATNREE